MGRGGGGEGGCGGELRDGGGTLGRGDGMVGSAVDSVAVTYDDPGISFISVDCVGVEFD